MKKITHFLVILTFLVSTLSISNVSAGEVVVPIMPKPGTMVNLSPVYKPAFLNGLVIHPDNALQFDFLIHKGEGNLDEAQKDEEYTKLVKYFLASLTIPDSDQWVNLSPYENDRIIKDNFGKTEMGRDLLSQDYLLKQITSSLMYPENGLGKNFWNQVYERAYQEFGNVQVPVNTFNKVWIVPDEALVYESGNTAYVVKSHLKVMLEEDYLSLEKHTAVSDIPNKAHAISSKMIKEIILPALEKEVNEGKNFAQLRQIYSGMILATWYKAALKESLLGKVYADKAKVVGVDLLSSSSASIGDPEKIYQQYLTAFKKGVYNYIKEDVDRYTKQIIPRKYFSGGFQPKPGTVTTNKVSQAMMTAAMTQASQMDLAAIALSLPTENSLQRLSSFFDPRKNADLFKEWKSIPSRKQEAVVPFTQAVYMLSLTGDKPKYFKIYFNNGSNDGYARSWYAQVLNADLTPSTKERPINLGINPNSIDSVKIFNGATLTGEGIIDEGQIFNKLGPRFNISIGSLDGKVYLLDGTVQSYQNIFRESVRWRPIKDIDSNRIGETVRVSSIKQPVFKDNNGDIWTIGIDVQANVKLFAVQLNDPDDIKSEIGEKIYLDLLGVKKITFGQGNIHIGNITPNNALQQERGVWSQELSISGEKISIHIGADSAQSSNKGTIDKDGNLEKPVEFKSLSNPRSRKIYEAMEAIDVESRIVVDANTGPSGSLLIDENSDLIQNLVSMNAEVKEKQYSGVNASKMKFYSTIQAMGKVDPDLLILREKYRSLRERNIMFTDEALKIIDDSGIDKAMNAEDIKQLFDKLMLSYQTLEPNQYKMQGSTLERIREISPLFTFTQRGFLGFAMLYAYPNNFDDINKALGFSDDSKLTTRDERIRGAAQTVIFTIADIKMGKISIEILPKLASVYETFNSVEQKAIVRAAEGDQEILKRLGIDSAMIGRALKKMVGNVVRSVRFGDLKSEPNTDSGFNRRDRTPDDIWKSFTDGPDFLSTSPELASMKHISRYNSEDPIPVKLNRPFSPNDMQGQISFWEAQKDRIDSHSMPNPQTTMQEFKGRKLNLVIVDVAGNKKDIEGEILAIEPRELQNNGYIVQFKQTILNNNKVSYSTVQIGADTIDMMYDNKDGRIEKAHFKPITAWWTGTKLDPKSVDSVWEKDIDPASDVMVLRQDVDINDVIAKNFDLDSSSLLRSTLTSMMERMKPKLIWQKNIGQLIALSELVPQAKWLKKVGDRSFSADGLEKPESVLAFNGVKPLVVPDRVKPLLDPFLFLTKGQRYSIIFVDDHIEDDQTFVGKSPSGFVFEPTLGVEVVHSISKIVSINGADGKVVWSRTLSSNDAAMIKDRKGGIDLNAANLNFQIKRDGLGVPLPIAQQDMNMLQQIQGFIPTIIEIRPVTTMPMFSHLDEAKPQDYASAS